MARRCLAPDMCLGPLADQQVRLAHSHVIISCHARRCLAPDVWLGPLADRLVRLALQLLTRYATWLRAGLDARVGAAHAPADPALQPGQVSATHPRAFQGLENFEGLSWGVPPYLGIRRQKLVLCARTCRPVRAAPDSDSE